jgi:signal transduction histidine kinase
VGRPSPADYQPPLTVWSHAWRALLVAAVSGFVWFTVNEQRTEPRLLLDLALGVPALVLFWWRRRLPVTVAVLTVVLSAGSALAAGPAVLASVSLASRRVWPEVLGIGVLNMVAAFAFSMVHPMNQSESLWITQASNLVFTAGMLAFGMYVGSRRELLWTLRARAERAEAEQELRADRSRLEERGRIAREMHDVLAHRISQISMRANALDYRDDLSADELREGITVIRETAQHALTDLRGVLGVLRDPEGGPLHAPQPTYDDLGQLVAEARRSGQRVVLDDTVAPDAEVPDPTGRALYRIVQEGLTNARKHAPGAELSVELRGCPETGLDVVLSNPLGFAPGTPRPVPGAGLGLVGLTERVALHGGRVEHGPRDGAFVLRCWLPWAA